MEGDVRGGHQDTFGFDGYFHYYACGADFMGVYRGPNLSNGIICAVYGMSVWSQLEL